MVSRSVIEEIRRAASEYLERGGEGGPSRTTAENLSSKKQTQKALNINTQRGHKSVNITVHR